MSDAWSHKHGKMYATSDWIGKPALFAETALSYFPGQGKLLDLGAGQGQDSRFFARHGYAVVSTDLEPKALELSAQNLPAELADKVTLQKVDLRELLPFEDCSFDVIYAHQSLHYFTDQTTHELFAEILRVLRPGGVFACIVNATTDPEYGKGMQIEPDYFGVDGFDKHYFSTQSLATYAVGFEALLLDDQGETYKDTAKGVHNLIRFVGKKPE